MENTYKDYKDYKEHRFDVIGDVKEYKFYLEGDDITKLIQGYFESSECQLNMFEIRSLISSLMIADKTLYKRAVLDTDEKTISFYKE